LGRLYKEYPKLVEITIRNTQMPPKYPLLGLGPTRGRAYPQDKGKGKSGIRVAKVYP